ncbi:MAG TPA: sulfite exporter TauE/SafE family protein, partial [Flavobacteriales bacterium]|nr:sulfite exporter TauE/SafE family protein [Flavobacteriales bacterium]
LINLVVSAVAFAQYARAGHFRWALFWPFAIASVPLAWVGARITIDPMLYKRLLALCLLFAVLRLFGVFGSQRGEVIPVPLLWALFIGAALGFVSGLIGIGGGILLSPILLLMCWADTKVTACVSALFIFVNSAAGLLGIERLSNAVDQRFLIWSAIALVAGLAGSYIGARRLPPVRLRQALAVVLLFASIKLWWP